MFELSDYGKRIVAGYKYVVPELLTIAIPFTGVASQTLATIPTDLCTDDVLITEISVDFLNALVQVIVKDNTNYTWNENDTPCPIHAIAGAATQVMPVLRLPVEYLLWNNSRLQFTFTNAASSPESVTRYLTCRGLRLKDKLATS